MLTSNNNLSSNVRSIKAKVELYNGSTLADTFNYNDKLISYSVERAGEKSKFFGFGICQKANIKVLDTKREKVITTNDVLKINVRADGDYINPYPNFYVTETHRDENTNQLSITAYDAIYSAAAHTFNELALTAPYTVEDVAAACCGALGLGYSIKGLAANETCFNTIFPTGANFDGTETLREVLNAVAEVTQTIYYVLNDEIIVFRRLDKDGTADITITKHDYITLKNNDNRRLAAICSATELGDNVTAALEVSGTTQYIRDNPFWDIRDDVGLLVENALAAIGGLTINQFNCDWRGDFHAEIGDKMALETKNGDWVYSYLLDDTTAYNGFFGSKTAWQFEDNQNETESNPANLGEALKSTFAKVDKANKEITIMASEINANTSNIAAISANTSSITASVENIESKINDTQSDITTINNRLSATITSEDLTIEVTNALENGVTSVTTTTGYKLDADGLTVGKSGSDLETTISDDGMKVEKGGDDVLTASHKGVKAVDLHATTYLIIGNNSRFEDYTKDGESRTACFWIGG